MAIMMIGMNRITYSAGLPAKSAPLYFNPMSIFWVTLMPTVMCAFAWHRGMWRFIELESLKPIGRPQLFKELGLAAALDAISAWCMFAVVMAADQLIFGHRAMNMNLLLVLLIASPMLQPFQFGMLAWMLRYRSPSVLTVMAMVAFVIPTTPLAIASGLDSSKSQAIAISIACLCAVLGLAITRDAYRRWLVTELG